MKMKLDFEELMDYALSLPDAKSNMPHWGDFLANLMADIEQAHPEKYEKLYIDFYTKSVGWFFNEDMAEYALSKFMNKDGTKGMIWTLDESLAVAKKHNISFTQFTDCDWWFTLNMMYSDYCDAEYPKTDPDHYAMLASDYLKDLDVPSGKMNGSDYGSKPFRYWKKVVMWKPEKKISK